MFCERTKGQTTLEVVMLLGFVVAALIVMSVYMKRGVQGKLRESTDQIGDQYSAGHVESTYLTVTDMEQVENSRANGGSSIEIIKNTQTKTGNEVVKSKGSDGVYYGY